jgi:hypothetical protein
MRLTMNYLRAVKNVRPGSADTASMNRTALRRIAAIVSGPGAGLRGVAARY